MSQSIGKNSSANISNGTFMPLAVTHIKFCQPWIVSWRTLDLAVMIEPLTTLLSCTVEHVRAQKSFNVLQIKSRSRLPILTPAIDSPEIVRIFGNTRKCSLESSWIFNLSLKISSKITLEMARKAKMSGGAFGPSLKVLRASLTESFRHVGGIWLVKLVSSTMSRLRRLSPPYHTSMDTAATTLVVNTDTIPHTHLSPP